MFESFFPRACKRSAKDHIFRDATTSNSAGDFRSKLERVKSNLANFVMNVDFPYLFSLCLLFSLGIFAYLFSFVLSFCFSLYMFIIISVDPRMIS